MPSDVLLFVAVGFAAQLVDGAIGMAYGLTDPENEVVILLHDKVRLERRMPTRRSLWFLRTRSTSAGATFSPIRRSRRSSQTSSRLI